MKLILTNDDGVDAPGIQALQQAVAGMGIIVAPKKQHSGCGHQITTDRPLQLHCRSENEYAVDGTPADCSRLALTQIVRDADWVLSGINAGGNLGVDVYVSGTVAAVREAAILGVRGIAISHWIKRPWEIDWKQATRWTKMVLEDLMARPIPVGTYWNVNLPHLKPNSPEPEIVFCEPSIEPLPVEYRVEESLYYYQGNYDQRSRFPGSDVDVCFSGKIAVTKLSL